MWYIIFCDTLDYLLVLVVLEKYFETFLLRRNRRANFARKNKLSQNFYHYLNYSESKSLSHFLLETVQF